MSSPRDERPSANRIPYFVFAVRRHPNAPSTPSERLYSDVCHSNAGPGHDAPSWARKAIYRLYLGPGRLAERPPGAAAGCAGRSSERFLLTQHLRPASMTTYTAGARDRLQIQSGDCEDTRNFSVFGRV
jgi:hypothetical protein